MQGVLYLSDNCNDKGWSVAVDDLCPSYARRAMATALFQCVVSHCVQHGIDDLGRAVEEVKSQCTNWDKVRVGWGAGGLGLGARRHCSR